MLQSLIGTAHRQTSWAGQHWSSTETGALDTQALLIVSRYFDALGELEIVLARRRVALYQTACFPLYGIPRVRRRDYLAFDRVTVASWTMATPTPPLRRRR
jgi:hypothetical protein